MPSEQHICMLAAENDVIPGAKVGGIGDVIRDIPAALAKTGATVSVVIPAYGLFHTLPGARHVQSVRVPFMSRIDTVDIFELFEGRDEGVHYYVLHHPLFGVGGAGQVYCNDGGDQPFATDANKFALFSLAALITVREQILGAIDVLHLHDWHTGFAAILRSFDPNFEALKAIPCVFSLHNLALQGIRPLAENTSSLYSWYPWLNHDTAAVRDPRWPACVNPVAAGIRLADKVHTVSPTYAREILQPNAPERGFHGGEGLELDLQQAADEQRLVGIINGISYDSPPKALLDWRTLISGISDRVLSWIGSSETIRPIDYLSHHRALSWQSTDRPAHVLTSVGRLTEQKMSLLLTRLQSADETEQSRTVLDHMLATLTDRGVFILLGSGDPDLEAQCQDAAARHDNFLFLNRYDQSLSDELFANGDLFVMPSSFEPCGISQMLAMRQGQPCLVHAVGGLCDTVNDSVDGYHFSGETIEAQSRNLLSRLQDVVEQRESEPGAYRAIVREARSRRFLWENSAQRYIKELYS